MSWLITAVIVGVYLRIALAAFRSAVRRLKAEFPTLPIDASDLVVGAWIGLMWPIGWPVVCLVSPYPRPDGSDSFVTAWLRHKAGGIK